MKLARAASPAGGQTRQAALATVPDLRRVLLLTALGFVSWVLPTKAWAPCLGGAVRIANRVAPRRAREYERWLSGSGLPREPAGSSSAAARAYTANQWLLNVMFLREHRPGGWRPTITLEGRENLEAALNAGRGAVLWVTDTVPSSLIVKRGLFESGFAVTHLSRTSHGPGVSQSRLSDGLRRLQTSVEERYLGHREVIVDSPVGPLRRLNDRLLANECVSITAWNKSNRTCRVSLTGREFELATGPIELARLAKSQLLPVFTLQSGPSSFRVVVGQSLPLDGPQRDEPPAAAKHYAAQLDAYLVRQPYHWQGWSNGMARS